jgi:hypothetical protein
MRANLSNMLRLRTKARAAVDRGLILVAMMLGRRPASAHKYGV